jgi:TRAP-type mannitol/chloroaromatic compound transport system substrate-binding protein
MKRRGFLGGAAIGGAAAAAASSFPAPAIAQGNTQWRMVTTWPKNYPGQGTAAERFAKTIGEATDGRLTIQVYGAGELVPAFESFDAVQSGAAEAMHATPYYWQGKSKAMNFFSTVPYGMTTAELTAWTKYGGGQELWDELYDGFGLKGWHGGSTGVQMGGWFNKEINSLADIQGLKMRIPGLGGEMMRRLGATVVNLPAGEIFPALQAGAVDATEWVGPFNDLALGVYKVTKFYYWPGVHEPGTEVEITVSKEAFDELPADVQKIFELVTQAEETLLTAEFNARNGDALSTLINEHDVEFRRFPDDVLEGFGKASGEVIAEMRDTGDEMTKKIVDSFLEHRRKLMNWSNYGEFAYMQARALPFDYAS